jgi:hypothetical protein
MTITATKANMKLPISLMVANSLYIVLLLDVFDKYGSMLFEI